MTSTSSAQKATPEEPLTSSGSGDVRSVEKMPAIEPIVAGILLIAISPALLGIAALILLLDGRPVLFRHTRVGLGGAQFKVIKFRTMSLGDGPELTVGGDARVTRVGRLLRESKMDELPQLLNIVRGEMRFVGARPESPHFVSRAPELFEPLRSVRPGITDPASITFSDESNLLAQQSDPESFYVNELLPQKLRMSHAYQMRRTATSDLAIVLKTLLKVAR